jgi:hypothetical protein
MTRVTVFPGGPEVVRMVFEHAQAHALQWAAITSIAQKIGYGSTLRSWGAARRALFGPAAGVDPRRAGAIQAT